MMKRILGGAAAAGLALSLLSAGSASATCGETQSPIANPQTVTVPGRGPTTIYRTPATPSPTTTGGYIGVTGGAGWIEVGGSTASGGGIQGSATGTPVNGRVFVTPSGGASACVADRVIK